MAARKKKAAKRKTAARSRAAAPKLDKPRNRKAWLPGFPRDPGLYWAGWQCGATAIVSVAGGQMHFPAPGHERAPQTLVGTRDKWMPSARQDSEPPVVFYGPLPECPPLPDLDPPE